MPGEKPLLTIGGYRHFDCTLLTPGLSAVLTGEATGIAAGVAGAEVKARHIDSAGGGFGKCHGHASKIRGAAVPDTCV
jgi:hypothetical protein